MKGELTVLKIGGGHVLCEKELHALETFITIFWTQWGSVTAGPIF